MASILGLKGYNKSASTSNILLAAYGNDIINVATGLGYGLALNGNDVEMEAFLDRIFAQNYNTSPITFNGTTWSRDYTSRMPISKYLRAWKSRLYLGNCLFDGPQAPLDASSNAIVMPSKVFYPDFFQGNTLTWGIEWGRNGATTAGTRIFEAKNVNGLPQDFKANNIKVGDPLFITSGNAQLVSERPYLVTSVESPYRILVDRDFPVSATSLHYWVGSNWFDVATDDNDYITWIEENNDQLVLWKRFSLWRYNQTSLQRIKNAPGTTSGRSVANMGDLTIYFHASNTNTRKTGFYGYNGSRSVLVSRAIQPYIDGISLSATPVAWREGTKYRCYVGTITNTPKGISVSNAVITLDVEGNQWQIDPIADVVTASGRWIESGAEKYFIGTNDNEVMETPSGNSHNGDPISWAIEKGVTYPSGSEVVNEFTRIQVVSRNAAGVQFLYKLFGTPEDDDDQWHSLGDIKHNHQEFVFKTKHNMGRGIDVRFQERSTGVNTLLIQKITGFCVPITTNPTQKP